MNKLTLEAAAGVYSGTAHDAKPHPMHIERNKAFKAGAEWQRNHVWHKANEKPSSTDLTLAKTPFGAFICGPNYEDWQQSVDEFGIETWAYVHDLYPTGRDERQEP